MAPSSYSTLALPAVQAPDLSGPMPLNGWYTHALCRDSWLEGWARLSPEQFAPVGAYVITSWSGRRKTNKGRAGARQLERMAQLEAHARTVMKETATAAGWEERFVMWRGQERLYWFPPEPEPPADEPDPSAAYELAAVAAICTPPSAYTQGRGWEASEPDGPPSWADEPNTFEPEPPKGPQDGPQDGQESPRLPSWARVPTGPLVPPSGAGLWGGGPDEPPGWPWRRDDDPDGPMYVLLVDDGTGRGTRANVAIWQDDYACWYWDVLHWRPWLLPASWPDSACDYQPSPVGAQMAALAALAVLLHPVPPSPSSRGRLPSAAREAGEDITPCS